MNDSIAKANVSNTLEKMLHTDYIHQRQDGTYLIYVYACAGTSKNCISGKYTDEHNVSYLRIYVSAAREKGLANKAIQELLAKHLNIRPSALSIIAGELSQKKIWKCCK